MLGAKLRALVDQLVPPVEEKLPFNQKQARMFASDIKTHMQEMTKLV